MLSQILSCPGDSPGWEGQSGDWWDNERSRLFHDPGSESDSESDRYGLPVPSARRRGHQLDDDDPGASGASASCGQGSDSDSEVNSGSEQQTERSCDEAPGTLT